MAERHHAPIHLPKPPRSKSLSEHITSWYGVGTVIVGIFGGGWALRSFAGTKADAIALEHKADAEPVASLSNVVSTDHETIVKVQQEVHDLAENVHGMRQDIRDVQAGRSLPPLPSPTPTK